MTRVYCDKCGVELIWPSSPNIAQSNMYADLRTILQNCNCNGFKTYDPTSGMYLDLCTNCSASLLWCNEKAVGQNDNSNQYL